MLEEENDESQKDIKLEMMDKDGTGKDEEDKPKTEVVEQTQDTNDGAQHTVTEVMETDLPAVSM